MPPTTQTSAPASVLIGAGRSGAVYKERDRTGRIVARKVFDSDPLTKLVQYVFLGGPNPYAWNEHAIEAAALRRRILAPLVRHWFGAKLRVAQAWSQDWNVDQLAYQLHTEFIAGRPPTLHHPMNRRGAFETDDLLRNVMQPLQARLTEAGFEGLVWQAGHGNPVALANFLLEHSSEGELRWAWIDLESGVPALFPANPIALVRCYLPLAWRLRRAPFDDVDVERFVTWLDGHRAQLVASLGAHTVAQLAHDAERLRHHQHEWKSLRRVECSIGYRVKKGELEPELGRWYAQRPLRWYAREAGRLPGAARRLLLRARDRLRAWLARIPWRELPRSTGRFLVSQRYRFEVARSISKHRIAAWERRGQLDVQEASTLTEHLDSEESAAYLSDFAVHVALKPFVKVFEWLLLPALFALGWIGPAALGLGIVISGPVARTLYTLARLLQSAATGRERPWVALGVGVLPVVGNLAYPLQIVYSSTVADDLLAQFLIYDGCTALGRKLPIWGGKDTLTEHAFNRAPDRWVRRGSP